MKTKWQTHSTLIFTPSRLWHQKKLSMTYFHSQSYITDVHTYRNRWLYKQQQDCYIANHTRSSILSDHCERGRLSSKSWAKSSSMCSDMTRFLGFHTELVRTVLQWDSSIQHLQGVSARLTWVVLNWHCAICIVDHWRMILLEWWCRYHRCVAPTNHIPQSTGLISSITMTIPYNTVIYIGIFTACSKAEINHHKWPHYQVYCVWTCDEKLFL